MRIYRTALLWHARSTAATARSAASRREAADLIPKLEDARGVAGRPQKQARASRSIPEKDYQDLLAALHASALTGSHWAARASNWLMAGVLSGVRPVEWLSANWDPNEPRVLVVRNAKAKLSAPAFMRRGDAAQPEHLELGDETQGADLPPSDAPAATPTEPSAVYRRIPVGSEFDVQAITTHMDSLWYFIARWPGLKKHRRPGRPSKSDLANIAPVPLHHLSDHDVEEAYVAYYDGVRNTIRTVCHRLWGNDKSYSLYSLRHQFSANSRAAVGPSRTHDLMGHSATGAVSYASQSAAFARHKSQGAERIREHGPEMPAQIREQLQHRRQANVNPALGEQMQADSL